MFRDSRVETYRIQLTTPAFLGGSDQAAEWRLAPFKALLRRWWRVVWWCRNSQPTVQKLRDAEGNLFGAAADAQKRASRVRIRIENWSLDYGDTIPKATYEFYPFTAIHHPEIGRQVRIDLYLGYGPITWQQNKVEMTRSSALKDGAQRLLKLMYPDSHAFELKDTVLLAALFGTIGARSRNGWGSLDLHMQSEAGMKTLFDSRFWNPEESKFRHDLLNPFARPWRDALDQDWCHAVGLDGTDLLLWRTEEKDDWKDVLATLAKVKIAFRTDLHIKGAGPHKRLCERQVLAYPVTNHVLNAWGNASRSANQLLFKVHRTSEGRYVGLVVHMPHGLPKPLRDRLNAEDQKPLRQLEQKVWRDIHKSLDGSLTRLS